MSKHSRMPRAVLLGSGLLALSGSSLAISPMDGGYMQTTHSAAADAADAAREGSCGAKSGHEGRCGAMFDKMDANHDGKISRAEFDAANAAMFEAADTNHDGVLTREELAAYHAKMHKSDAEMKCGEGKCGAAMKKSDAEMKCGEGKCGASAPKKPAGKKP